MVTRRFCKMTWMICIFIGTGFICGIASADILLYGTTSNGDPGNSTLVEIDPVNGDLLETIGSGVGYLVNGMAWDYKAQTLYASTDDAAFTGLITINIETGVGSVAGTPDWGQSAGFSVSNITIDSDDNMVGWASTNQLVEIDKTTGEITTFTDTTIAAVDFGLSYDRFNLLYMINGVNGDLYVFVEDDQAFTQGPSVEHECRQGDFHPTNNYYYGIEDTGTDTRSLVIINPALDGGNFWNSYETVDQLHTLAYIVTGKASSGSDSSNCFIRSIANAD